MRPTRRWRAHRARGGRSLPARARPAPAPPPHHPAPPQRRPHTTPGGRPVGGHQARAGRNRCRIPPGGRPHRGAVPASHRRSHRRRIRRRHHGRRRPSACTSRAVLRRAAAPEPRPEPLAESQHLRPQVFGTPGTLLRRRALGRSTLGRPRRRHASLPEPKRRSPFELGRGRRGFTGWGLMSDLLDQGLVSSLGGHRAPAPSLFECRQRRPPEVQSSESGGADVEDREEQGGEPPRQRQR